MDQNTKDYTKEELEILYNNLNVEYERLCNKLFILTGCKHFGDDDGMDGSCIDCHIYNSDLHKRCELFRFAYDKYLGNLNKKY